MIKIKGLDDLSKQLKEAENALSGLDGELGSVNFDPNDPASIDAAIAAMETMIDERLGRHLSNPIAGQLAEGMKQQYREAILERAAEARQGNSDE